MSAVQLLSVLKRSFQGVVTVLCRKQHLKELHDRGVLSDMDLSSMEEAKGMAEGVSSVNQRGRDS